MVTGAGGTFDGWRIAFGEVRHARLRPVRHAFNYPAFFLRVPVRELDGRPRGSWMFGVNRPALVCLRESDHGDGSGARAWIEGLLRRAGVAADGEIALIAFPRVLGYQFKPVSFWMCHDRGGTLRAVVAEVNNTFGERHAYLLCDPAGRALRNGQELRAAKVFHVSPFCGVTGEYRFRFFDDPRRGLARIDYDDDAGNAVLVTSVSGRYAPLDARSVTRALLAYPAFTLGVIARIHWQALQLWLRRVPLHPKPPPPTISVSRDPR
jgi:DUF1365 family protein